MPFGLATRMWTLHEYIKEYRKIQAENERLKENNSHLAMLMQDIRNASDAQQQQSLINLRAENADLKKALKDDSERIAKIVKFEAEIKRLQQLLKRWLERNEFLIEERNDLQDKNAELEQDNLVLAAENLRLHETPKEEKSKAYIVENRTSTVFFESRDDAEKYAGKGGATSGIEVTEITILPKGSVI